MAETLFKIIDAELATAESSASCEHCGCKLATVFGGLEHHAGDCPNLPL